MNIIDILYTRLPGPGAAIQALRWSIVFIFTLFGIAKFAAYEAEGVARIAEHYWLFSWMYPLWGVQGASNAIGVLELSAGALIAAGAWSHRAGLIGGAMGIATFLVTLSFSIGTNLWQKGYGFPFMGSLAQFLFKDVVLLAACFALALHAGHGLAQKRGNPAQSIPSAS